METVARLGTGDRTGSGATAGCGGWWPRRPWWWSPPAADGSSGPSVLGRSLYGWFRLLPDGSGVLVTVGGPLDPDGFPSPVVERWSSDR